MPFREVIRAQKLGGEFAGHSRQHARRVATAACEPFRDQIRPDQEFLDLYQYQVAVGEELHQMRSELIAIDDRHALERERNRQLRNRRERWVGELRNALKNLKETLDGSYGGGTSRRVFQEDPPRVPDDPVAVFQVGQRAFDTLSDSGFDLQPAQPGVAINPRVLAEGFEPPLRGLGEVLDQLHNNRSEIRHTQSEKDALLERVEAYSRQVVRFYESLYELAGYDRLSKRLRQSSHVRRGEDGGEAGPAPASAAVPAVADGSTPAADDEAEIANAETTPETPQENTA